MRTLRDLLVNALFVVILCNAVSSLLAHAGEQPHHHHHSSLAALKIHNIRHQSGDGRRVNINASPTLINNGDWVTTTWRTDKPDNSDWIGVFSPSNVDVTRTAPVKYQFANFSNTEYVTSGTGGFKFKMVNMHADFLFAFFTNGTDYPIFIGKSNVCTFTNLEEPLQGHLSLTENPSEMRLGWATGYNTQQTQWVKWGTEPTIYSWSAAATSYTYTQDQLCGTPAAGIGWRDPGPLHTAILNNLQPSTRYYYIYGSDETGWSSEFSFRSAPVSAPTSEVTLIAYGDMGKGEEDDSLEHWEERPSLNTTRNVITQIDEIDLVVHIGDISYAVGYSAQWDAFMSQILPIATAVPYMTSPGNHERDFPNSGSIYNGTDSGGECGVPYENRFIMPPPSSDHILSQIFKDEAPRDDTPWYSFDYGNIHLVMMSTEHDFSVGSDQYYWIAGDLAAVDRTVTPWLIFTGHRPMYIDSTNNSTKSGTDQSVATQLRESIEPLLIKYKVNLGLWGHHHSYQRSCPVFQEECQSDPSYPVHVVIGMAGMGLTKTLQRTPPAWAEYLDDMEYGYTRIHTTMYSLHFQYFSNDNILKDEFTLVQDP